MTKFTLPAADSVDWRNERRGHPEIQLYEILTGIDLRNRGNLEAEAAVLRPEIDLARPKQQERVYELVTKVAELTGMGGPYMSSAHQEVQEAYNSGDVERFRKAVDDVLDRILKD